MAPRYSVQVRGVEKMLPKLTSNVIYRSAWKRVLESALVILRGHVQRRAPVRSGAMLASVTTAMDAKPLPMWGKVIGSGVNKANGFRYGHALNASSRYRYAGGSRAGGKTRGWLTGALFTSGGMKKTVQELLMQARAAIAAKWRQ